MDIKKREYAVAFHEDEKGRNKIGDIEKRKWTIIKNPKFGWCADPFLYRHDGEYYIFAEMYMYTRGYGGIGYCKWEGNGFSKWKLIIEEPYHLSYPNIFQYENVIYICPESGMSNEIYLYRCVDFPDKWVKDKVLFEGYDCADTTYISEFEGKESKALSYGITWRGLEKGLYFFRVEDGKIVIRDDDFVTKDNTYARPAGKFCVEDGTIYRPGQIGEPNYGAGLAIVKCILSDGIYGEEVVKKTFADQFSFSKCLGEITGVHTYNRLERFEVIDLQYNKFETISRILRIVGRFNRKRRLREWRKTDG